MYIIHVRNDNDLDRYNNLVKKVPSIVMFYADWCGHCNNFKPHWNKFERLAREQHRNNDFMIARINEHFVNKVEGHSNVSGFPTIYHLMNGEHNADYEKQRDVDGLIEFLSEVHPGIRIQNGGKRKKHHKTKRNTTRKTYKKLRNNRKTNKKHRKPKRKTVRRK